jgi:hypothetical protein
VGKNGSTDAGLGVEIAARREETRRTLLAKAGLLAAGSVGAAALTHPEKAMAVAPPPLLGSFYNVKDYGALGDGVANDQPAIQAAVRAAFEANPAGGIVWFPPGTYLTAAAIQSRSGVSLVGSGSQSIIKATAGRTGTIVTGISASHLTVADLVFDGNRHPGNHLFFRGNDSDPATNVHVHRCEVRNGEGKGIVFHNVHEGSVVGCWIHDTGVGAQRDAIGLFLNCEDIRIADNLVEKSADTAIGLFSEAGPRTAPHLLRRIAVVGNVLIGGPDSNAVIGGSGARELTIAGNVVQGGEAAGISITNFYDTPGEDVQISDNVVVEGGIGTDFGDGISISGALAGTGVDDYGSTGCSRVTISDNIVKNSRHNGISLIAHPATTDSRAAGHAQPGALKDITVARNVIHLDPPGTPGTVIEPHARGITSHSLGAPIENLVIDGNTIRNARSDGMWIVNDHREVAITGNRVFDSGLSGAASALHLESGASASIRNVQVMGNRCADTRDGSAKTQSYGLDANDLRGNVLVVANDFTGNKSGVVRIVGATAATSLRVRDNPGYSPWAGAATVDGGSGWNPLYFGATSAWYRDKDGIVFELPFPATPTVLLTPSQPAHAALVKSATPGQFSIRAIVFGTDPGPAATPAVHWLAEPRD